MKSKNLYQRNDFYFETVKELIPNNGSSILICGGGLLDKSVFNELGFENVTITNLDTRTPEKEYAPFKWDLQNAQDLSYDNESYDYVVIHAAIHHTSMPHKTLLELFRVCKYGVLAFESRDSLLMNLFERLNLTQTYEHAAVYHNDCKYGGINNTQIPNYIYRWTEREIEKTINTYSPCYDHEFQYKYGAAFPCTAALEKRGTLKTIFLKSVLPFYLVFIKIFKKQQNLFAFFIKKPTSKSRLKPWLKKSKDNEIIFNKDWAVNKYK